MPCKKGMGGCRSTCLHRMHVRDYQIARHAAEIAREETTRGYATEESEHPPILTFKKWLQDTAGWNTPPDESPAGGHHEQAPTEHEPDYRDEPAGEDLAS